MAGMNMRTKLSRGVAKVRDAGGARVDMVKLAARVKELEVEVQECRQLNLRLAELTDVVQELLLPVAQRDEARVAEVMERYTKNLG
jgi:flagellar biosynthesis/type III secretory pathway chaperone